MQVLTQQCTAGNPIRDPKSDALTTTTPIHPSYYAVAQKNRRPIKRKQKSTFDCGETFSVN